MSITPIRRPADHGFADPPSERPAPDADANQIEDSFLTRALAQGDPAALEQLITHYWEPLTSYASRILDDMALAEDVVQKVFVGVWRDREKWSPRSVRSYLFRSTRNLALDELRSRQARDQRERAAEANAGRQPRMPDAILEDLDITAAVDAAIQKLPERRREAFVLAYLRHLSYNEVAAVMGISSKTVGHHLSAALAELREALEPMVIDYPSPDSDQTIRPLHRDYPPA